MSNKQISIYGILILILVLPLISATSYESYGYKNDTSYYSNGLNLTINITSPLYFGILINDNSIYIENLKINDLDSCSISINITESNKTYTDIYLVSLINNQCTIIPTNPPSYSVGPITSSSNQTNVSIQSNTNNQTKESNQTTFQNLYNKITGQENRNLIYIISGIIIFLIVFMIIIIAIASKGSKSKEKDSAY